MKRPSNTNQGSSDEQRWEPCSRGVIRKAASRQLSRRRKLLKLIAGGTALAAVGGGAAIGFQLSKNPNRAKGRNGLPVMGGLACLSVRELMPNYLDGKLDKLIAEQVTSHLMDCPKCRRMYTRLCCSSDSKRVSPPRNPKFKTTPCESR